MTRFVHFYPFRTDRSDGGTMRLQTAVRATSKLGPTDVRWFDEARQAWTGDAGNRPSTPSIRGGLKRGLFPSTLFESGHRAVSALVDRGLSENVDADTVVVLHTSYLAPAIARSRLAEGAIADVYDLVWRAHEIDGRFSPAWISALRKGYAWTVRRREEKALAGARALAVAGWSDLQDVKGLGLPSAWCPTGSPVKSVEAPIARAELRIGFLGNFAHQATMDSAVNLLRSPAARSQSVHVVLGGWESNHRPELARMGASTLGPVEAPADFWAQVDCAVVPSFSGTGMKCKIAEALLSHRSVVTTPLGAAGFNSTVRRALTIVEAIEDLDEQACRDAMARPHPSGAIQGLTMEGAAQTYCEFVTSVL